MIILSIYIFLSVTISLVQSHGFLYDPPSRNSAWAYLPGFKNYTDLTALYCGTFDHQYYYNDGKCGVCGDEARANKLFENPGPYATGKIVKTYTQGQEIEIKHSTVADSYHGGYVEVKLCPLNGNMKEATQECLDQNVLEIVPNPRSYLNDKFKVTVELGTPPPPGKSGPFIEYTFKVKLPASITCERCVLQWVWVNDFRKATLFNGTQIGGIGAQQHFINCADIKIVSNGKPISNNSSIEKPKPKLKLSPPVFQCETWKTKSENKMPLVRNTSPDPNKYTGSGVICWNPKEDVWGSAESINQHIGLCTKCFLNCMSPTKTCPDDCYCRWFA